MMNMMADLVRAKALSMGRSAPQTKPEATASMAEASGISQGTRSDKKPLVRKGSGLPIWRLEGK